jgi:hypothetical protein
LTLSSSSLIDVQIVSRKDIEQRAKAASRMIHIAKVKISCSNPSLSFCHNCGGNGLQECLDRNNFNTASAILGGLNGAAVSRLQLTWEVCGASLISRILCVCVCVCVSI